ncbi:MAG TPA: SDR family NAD(P)-dependent oxidoreductase [Acidimicrobiia bacterium]|nr:SDR family NAD(P)-dependent oxidoreductase [Acidimicrobiia bacterium]
MSELRFDGRVAVVTGAGRGVGREYALLLAARGAKVVVNDLGCASDGSGASPGPADEVVAEITAAGGTALANGNDMTTADGCAGLIAAAHEAFGRVDILIHNAGYVFGDFDALLDIHVRAAHHLTDAAWPIMTEQGYGRVLLTSSGAGLYGSGLMPFYGAAKMAVFGLARCLADKATTAGAGIKVNLIGPCAATRLVTELPKSDPMDWVIAKAHPALIAPAAAYLVHEDCPVTGEMLSVGAGRVARNFVAETHGYLNPDLTLEDVRDHFGEVVAEDGYHVPADMNELVDVFMKIVGP